jgi:hypothetical protein
MSVPSAAKALELDDVLDGMAAQTSPPLDPAVREAVVEARAAFVAAPK